VTQPSPSDLAHQALQNMRQRADRENATAELHHRRYQNALASVQAEVREVHLYWTDLGHDPLVAAILTGITLDNLPEGV